MNLWTDGACKGGGSPGLAGAGVVLELPSGQKQEHSTFLGADLDSNTAEYAALLYGMGHAEMAGAVHLTCYLDSEVVVRQLNGLYKCRGALRPWMLQVRNAEKDFASVTYVHVPRAENKRADFLADEAVMEWLDMQA